MQQVELLGKYDGVYREVREFRICVYNLYTTLHASTVEKVLYRCLQDRSQTKLHCVPEKK